MKLQNLRAFTAPWLFPAATVALAAAIFIADTVADLEIAFPAFYTVVVLDVGPLLRAARRRLVGAGCIGLTLLSDLLTAASGSTGIGVVNTAISLLAIATTTYLSLKIEAEKAAAYEARSQLAHVGRVTTLGELTASIAHEVNQPLAATVINGNACLRWLADEPPNLDEARQAVTRLVKDANRASEIIAQVRALTKVSPPQKDWLVYQRHYPGDCQPDRQRDCAQRRHAAHRSRRRPAAGAGRPRAVAASHPQSRSQRASKP